MRCLPYACHGDPASDPFSRLQGRDRPCSFDFLFYEFKWVGIQAGIEDLQLCIYFLLQCPIFLAGVACFL